MKSTMFFLIVVISTVLSVASYGQSTELIPGKTIERKMLKGEIHQYYISLKKGDYVKLVVVQKGVDLLIDVINPSGKTMETVDSSNGTEGSDPISIEAEQTGKYELKIYPFNYDYEESDSIRLVLEEENQGDYAITGIVKLAEIDNEFSKGSKVEVLIPNDEKISDLKILGMVWGFLKYYHPNIAAGNYDWDYELFRILPKIMNTKSTQDRDNILTDWIKSLGSYKTAQKINEINREIKMSPDLDWITNSNFTANLKAELLKVKNAERNKQNYYIKIWGNGVPEFQNEKVYLNMKYPDDGFRLLSLYRYWNIIQYYFPYRNLIEEDWKDVLMEFVPKFINSANESEYQFVVKELIVRIQDSHAGIFNWLQDSTWRNYYGVNQATVVVTFIENKAVVTSFRDKELGQKSGLQVGDIISSINNKPVENIVSEKLKYTTGSNYPTQLRNMSYFLLMTSDTMLNIEFIRNGTSEFKEIKVYPYVGFQVKQDTCFKLITPNIAYLYLGSIQSDYLPDIFEKIKETKGLIIDLRCYPSDFIVFSLGKYLMPEPKEFVKFTSSSSTTPGLFTFNDTLEVGAKNNDYYKGKVVILVNEITQSSAEYHTMALRVAPKATVIGSTTAGADGNVSQFYLPGGIRTQISGIGVYYPDGTETQRIGIVPDIIVNPTIEGIRFGKDEMLEKAIEVINK